MRRVAAVLEVELLGHCLLPALREGDRTQPRMNPVDLLREQIEGAAPDVLQAMVRTFAQALMSAEADATCGAGYGRPSDERVNFRNGYRPPGEWDTRAGTTDLAIPKRRSGLYFPVPQPALDSGHYTFVWIDARDGEGPRARGTVNGATVLTRRPGGHQLRQGTLRSVTAAGDVRRALVPMSGCAVR